MSKKKATMTLKDFHGGSIPSDLPLPSAPGVIVRPSDRVGFDRPTAWGSPIGRADHRLRPGSAGGVRNFDDKTPFLPHTTHIGRNFDEDERTPLDGVSGPRRTVSDESIRALGVRSEPKLDHMEPNNRPVSNPSSYAARFAEGVNTPNFSGSRMNDQNVNGNIGQAVVGSSPNAWGLKKDVVVQEQVPVPWSAPDAATKLAHASALEKVSSGRWHSKQLSNHQIDVEVIRHPETESETHFQGYGMYIRNINENMDVQVGRESHEAALVRHAERSLTVDDGIQVGGKDIPVYERARSPMYSEMKERNHPIYADGLQPPPNVGKFGGSVLQPAETLERPKLKLLPRSRPLENVEPPPIDYKQSSEPGHEEYVRETYGKGNVFKTGLAGSESGSQVIDRPKLSLKPRLQPLEQLERNTETKRNTLFGGARPRELVLKERGIDDVAMNNHDRGHPSNRVKQDVTRAETTPVHAIPYRYNEKAEIAPFNHKTGKIIDRRDHRADAEKSDMQRRNWRSDNRRSSRDLEKQQPPLERPPSPETWRKPVEQPASPTGPRYGKTASAVEIVQNYSKLVSDPKTADRLSGHRGIPNRGQVPFSRLTGPHPRPQINGY